MAHVNAQCIEKPFILFKDHGSVHTIGFSLTFSSSNHSLYGSLRSSLHGALYGSDYFKITRCHRSIERWFFIFHFEIVIKVEVIKSLEHITEPHSFHGIGFMALLIIEVATLKIRPCIVPNIVYGFKDLRSHKARDSSSGTNLRCSNTCIGLLDVVLVRFSKLFDTWCQIAKHVYCSECYAF